MQKKKLNTIVRYSCLTCYDIIKYLFILLVIVIVMMTISLFFYNYNKNYKNISKKKEFGEQFVEESVCSDARKRLQYEKNGYVDCGKAEYDKDSNLHHETFMVMLDKSILGDIVRGINNLLDGLKTWTYSLTTVFGSMWTVFSVVCIWYYRMNNALGVMNWFQSKQ